jgi:hypothetical protein
LHKTFGQSAASLRYDFNAQRRVIQNLEGTAREIGFVLAKIESTSA